MKVLFKVLIYTVCVILAATTVFASVFVSYSQNTSGSYSSICEIDKNSREWISDNFYQYETVPQLLWGISKFAADNFTYSERKYFLIQTADFDKFVFEDGFYGVCFEFAVFAKVVAVCWAEEKGVDLDSFVCNIHYFDKNKKRTGHSYNYFEFNGERYILDLTIDVDCRKNGEELWGPNLLLTSMESYNEKYFDPYNTYYI